ncbi:putative Zn-dependent protease [Candidatus Terasakiella magnetica]|uniref:Putative Zn-dependent protease n=1 Tax=Candidatus Terasakiella magnetica TaxID=1867952 RepID=A0A1C3RFK3_9PROT|nr:M48 family metalloprotease [Candidatus Terasakiella magnetica]SCA56076.1 putative Zn-dependent protease [Candidatus Terasakiella magnetica]
MRSFFIAASLCALVLSTSGCSVNPATGQQSFTGVTSIEDDIKLGKQEYPKLIKRFGGKYDHEKIQKYINDLGQQLARVSELPNLAWEFTVLDNPEMNAMALPGGKITINRGIISLAENEAEIVAILGHEIGHVTARHTAQRISQGQIVQLGSILLGIVVGGPAGDIANYAGNAFIANYSRDQEMEADKLGIRYMTKLGYDPKASATFFKKLAEHTELEAKMKGEKGEQSHYSIFSTHPDTRVRISESQKIAKTYPVDLDLINRRTYLALIDGLEYGESIKQGIIDQQTFIHPDLRMEFTIPDDFEYFNTPKLLIATHKNGSAIRFDIAKRNNKHLPITHYLNEIWANKYNLRAVQQLEVNGLEAATGVVRINTKKGVRDIRYLAIADGEEIFQFRFLTPPDLTSKMEMAFRRTTYSFRRLSYREAKSIKGFHIGLHRVGHNDTISGLAQRMKVEKMKEDWLKVLNKEALSNGLQKGEFLKIVTR